MSKLLYKVELEYPMDFVVEVYDDGSNVASTSLIPSLTMKGNDFNELVSDFTDILKQGKYKHLHKQSQEHHYAPQGDSYGHTMTYGENYGKSEGKGRL